jgi:hypothetical protein
MLSKRKINKNKKTAWELLNEIPNTPEQRKIDREIAAIERRYEEKNKKKQKKSKTNYKRKRVVKNYKTDYYGYFAGKIWDALSNYGPLDKTSLVDNTKLNLDDFFIGIGWLARENKISKEMNCYKLDKTNLTYEIGEKAGKIWKYLELKGQADINSISKSINMNREEIFSAIGWLFRENKIKSLYKDNKFLYELT